MRTRATRILDAQGIPYDLLEFEAEDHTAAEAVERLGISPEQLFKTLVVRSSEGAVLLTCVPASHELSLRALARCAGTRSVETEVPDHGMAERGVDTGWMADASVEYVGMQN